MSDKNNRIIFAHNEEQPISEKEFEQSQTPYEQTETLKHRLIFWTATAAKELEQYGYSCNNIEKLIFAKEISEDETIYHYPGVIPQDAKAAERAACHVLKTAMTLWEAIFTDNKPLIANLGLEFGLAVASAHAMPFEELAIIGERRKQIQLDSGLRRGKDQTAERQPEWDKWQACADEIWRDRPKLSKTETAKRVKAKLKLSEKWDTVGRRIQKK